MQSNRIKASGKKRQEQNIVNGYDRIADRSAAAQTNIHGEESSDQKIVVGKSGQDETDTD